MLPLLKKGVSSFYNYYILNKARRAFGWKLVVSKRLNLKLLLNLDNLIDFLIYVKGVFEEEVIFAINNIKNKGSFLFIDVGSQMGQFSLYVKKKYPEAEVLSFEPLQPAFLQQRMNMQINQLEYFLFDCALSSTKGKATLYCPPNSHKDSYGKRNMGMSSLLPDLLCKPGEFVVFTVPLDDFKYVYQMHACIVLKIDVEGGEALVLSGAKDLIQSGVKIYIIIELLHEDFPEKAQKVDANLQEWGYVLCNAQWEVKAPVKLINANYFYKRPI